MQQHLYFGTLTNVHDEISFPWSISLNRMFFKYLDKYNIIPRSDVKVQFTNDSRYDRWTILFFFSNLKNYKVRWKVLWFLFGGSFKSYIKSQQSSVNNLEHPFPVCLQKKMVSRIHLSDKIRNFSGLACV